MAWYYTYAHKRIDREGAARSGIRQEVSATALDRTRDLFESTREYDVLVAITERTSDRAKRDMVRMATDLGRLRTTVVTVAEFLDVPHRVFHEDHAEVYDLDEPEWIRDESGDRPDWLPDGAFRPPKRTSGGVQIDAKRTDDRPTTKVEHREIDSEDHKEAIVDYATYEGYDLLVLERDRAHLHERMFGNETDWLLKNAPCDVMLVEDRGFDGADEIAVVAARGTYDPIKLLIADAVAEETGASIHLIQALGEDAPDTQREDVEQYHQELISICTVEARSSIIETDDRVAGLARFVGDADLLVTGVDSSGLRGRLLSSPSNQLVESVECTAVMVQGHDSTRAQGLIGRLLMNYVFK
nr:universal stress protein [Natranaeroarchaeum aerophilus]